MLLSRFRSLKSSSLISLSKVAQPIRSFNTAQWKYKESPYAVLGVSKSATKVDIKKAYFREAKKCHPDLNPNDPAATATFQKLSQAYEILSDEKTRRDFDNSSWNNWSSGFRQDEKAYEYQSNTQHRSAEEIFQSVLNDVDIVKDAVAVYFQEMEDDFKHAASNAQQGNWGEVAQVAKNHKFLIAGVVLPLVVFLRSPVALIAAGRIVMSVSQILLATLVTSGRIGQVASIVWTRIVQTAKRKKRRS